MTIDDAVKRLRGPKGTPGAHHDRAPGLRHAARVHGASATRSRCTPCPTSSWPAKKTGYIRLQDFNETTACRPGEAQGLRARAGEGACAALEEQGATSIILDIRDNPGGLLDQAFAVSNLFLKKGQLVVFTRGRTRRDESSYVTEGESRFADLPLVVLTSKHSASASEIVAGAIQDHDRGLIVGETTFGKGLVQTIMPLRNVRGYALALTTARYYTPSGRSIQRDYGSTALEDYVAPKERRKPCDERGRGRQAHRRRPQGVRRRRHHARLLRGAGDAEQVRVLPDRPPGLRRLLPRLRGQRDHGRGGDRGRGLALGPGAGEGPQSSTATSRSTRRRWPTSRPTSTRASCSYTPQDLADNRDGHRAADPGGDPAAGLRRGRGAPAQHGLGPAGAEGPGAGAPGGAAPAGPAAVRGRPRRGGGGGPRPGATAVGRAARGRVWPPLLALRAL